jgi:hypothetical protein
MLKFILITLLIIFVLVRIGSFIYRTLFWMLGARAGDRNMYRQPHQGQRPQQHRSTGEIIIDYIPGQDGNNKKTGSQGGEYVDYEEVK